MWDFHSFINSIFFPSSPLSALRFTLTQKKSELEEDLKNAAIKIRNATKNKNKAKSP